MKRFVWTAYSLGLAASLCAAPAVAWGDDTPRFVCQPRPHLELPPPPQGAPSIALERPVPVCPEGQVPAPVPRYGPKGKPGSGPLSPLPPATTFLYAATAESFAAAGAQVDFTQAQPILASTDDHTLVEMSLQTSDQRQTVEVGWIVFPASPAPQLFVFHWVDAVPTCYDACGWVQVSATRFPGMNVTVGPTPQRYMYQHFQNAWWVWYQSEWIGNFPDSLWTTPFSNANLIQWFGEVAAEEANPCTQMGDGLFGTTPGSAQLSNQALIDSSGTVVPGTASVGAVTRSGYYDVAQSDATDFTVGGPGLGCLTCGCAPWQTCGAGGPNQCGPPFIADSGTPGDGGAPSDGGSSPDAGASVDGGHSVDAGGSVDSGSGMDSGTVSSSDAGASDGGADAGGITDGGEPPDAGARSAPDAGALRDAGEGTDAGHAAPPPATGCGCGSSASAGTGAIALLSLLLARRRGRRLSPQ